MTFHGFFIGTKNIEAFNITKKEKVKAKQHICYGSS